MVPLAVSSHRRFVAAPSGARPQRRTEGRMRENADGGPGCAEVLGLLIQSSRAAPRAPIFYMSGILPRGFHVFRYLDSLVARSSRPCQVSCHPVGAGTRLRRRKQAFQRGEGGGEAWLFKCRLSSNNPLGPDPQFG